MLSYLIFSALVPIIKNKTGDTSDKNNYRSIALVTAAPKYLEICFLEVLDMYLITHDHQFGFKSKHSTDMCIFMVKSIVKYYTRQNSPVYTCFLDASKMTALIAEHYLANLLIAKYHC